MHVIRNTDESQKVAVDARLLDMRYLSYKEMGILMTMIVHPYNTTFSLSELVNGAKDGRESVLSGLQSLIEKRKVGKLPDGRYFAIIPEHLKS